MLKKHYFSVLAMTGALASAVLTGCVDDNYSLEDIDTTMKFQVNNLTLPLNLAPVKLADLVDLTSEECIDTINGEYVLIKEGEFTSDKMEIASIVAQPTADDQKNDEKVISPIVGGVAVPLSEYVRQFTYDYNDVDDYIVAIESGKVDVTLNLTIDVKHDNGQAIPGQFRNLKITLPSGFYGNVEAGSFSQVINEKSNHLVSIPSVSSDSNGRLSLNFHVNEFNFAASGAVLEDHNFSLVATLGILSGDFYATNTMDGKGKITTEMGVTELQVNSITGTIFYDVEDLKVNEDIMLNDLPDVLTDKRTQISLRNPQLYLSIINPLGSIGLTASSGFDLKQVRPAGEEIVEAYLANRLHIAGVETPQTYCLLPHPDQLKALNPNYPNAELYEFTNFGNIIYGDGLPEALKVDFSKPMIDQQRVVDFPLGVDLGQIRGDYTLFAPLELGENSTIYYEDEATDWGLSSDSDELDISLLVVEADVTSNLPIGVDLIVKPLDNNGNAITNVKVNPVEIPAGSTKHVEIKVESTNGAFRNLDGMRYTAMIKSAADAKALSPQSSLTLKNLKIRVTGNYIVKDNDDDDNE
ncbi:MAG: hypothetical protein HDS04_04655 [Bacteroides sp.]|nr:hypothetical protein [Bacteroides sp.]